MSRLATGILSAIALSLSFGVAQFASGGDLSEATQDGLSNSPFETSGSGAVAINRAPKADRVASIAGSPSQTRTISLRLDGFSDTSFLVRVPLTNVSGNSSAPPATKSGNRKPTLACEPVVSVLTEVAKLLQPGRCLT